MSDREHVESTHRPVTHDCVLADDARRATLPKKLIVAEAGIERTLVFLSICWRSIRQRYSRLDRPSK